MKKAIVEVDKAQVLEYLKVDIDRWGKRIQKADKESKEYQYLTGKLEGTIQALHYAGILNSTELAKLQMYFKENYGK